MKQAYETYELTHDTMRFRVEHFHDTQMGEPWKEHDGHGIVSEWTTRKKSPSERVLVSDRHSKRYYDVAASIKLAIKDGWDCEARRKLAQAEPARKWTKREIAAHAVNADFDYLRAWCNDEWHWCGVAVTLLDVDGNATNERESLWGIESTDTDHLRQTAKELMSEIVARVPFDGQLRIKVRNETVQS